MMVNLEIVSEHPVEAARRHPLLFVHGAWHGAWCWENFLPWFAERGFAAHAVSLRGHGDSEGRERLRRWGIRDYVTDLANAVGQVDGDPILVGHSMGGLVVQRYLENHTAPGAILLASVPVRGALATALRVARHHTHPFLEANLRLRLEPIVGSEELVRDLLFSAGTPEAVVRDTFSRVQDESYRAFLGMIFRRPHPRLVTSPVLIIGGTEDRIFIPGEIQATAAAYRTTATMMPGMGHDLMLETGWRDVAETIHDWALLQE